MEVGWREDGGEGEGEGGRRMEVEREGGRR
jgi:hypothetical protein